MSDRFLRLLAPIQLVWGSFLFIPPQLTWAFGLTLGGAVLLTGGYWQDFWFFYKHGTAYRERVAEIFRGSPLDPENYAPPSVGLTWFITALYTFGMFAYVYWGLSVRDHHAFGRPLTKIDAIYFALTTFTTTGFGDIAPVTTAGKIAVSLQMVVGFVLVAVALTLALSRNTPPEE